MTTLEKKPYGTIEDFNLKTSNYWEKRFVFVLNHQNLAPSIDGMIYPNSYSIPLKDQIFDKKYKDATGKIVPKVRMIQVIPGEKSIYKDEQTEDGQKAIPASKMFSKRGDLIVEGQEDQTLEFLLRCNFNGSNPDRNKEKKPIFYMLDVKQGLDAEMKKDEQETEAANWCYKAEFKNIVRYARVLGLDIDVDGDQLRHSLRQLARRDAQKFNDGLKNKHTNRKFYVLDAIDKGIVSVDLRSNTLSWANGNIITNSPLGKNPVDHFVDLSVSGEVQFDIVYRAIEKEVDPNTSAEQVKVIDNNTNKEQTKESNNNPIAVDINTTTEKLIEAGVQRGVVIKTKSWYTFQDKKHLGRAFNEAIDADAILKDALIKACK